VAFCDVSFHAQHTTRDAGVVVAFCDVSFHAQHTMRDAGFVAAENKNNTCLSILVLVFCIVLVLTWVMGAK
jgi:hypothetical protein